MEAHEKVVQYLSEAHATELALVQTLMAHSAIAPRGPYRTILERHLDETREQAMRIEERLGQLGQSRNPLQVTYGIVQGVVGQLLALGKAPIDLLRGTGGEEKLLKNAKDEAASEALEIATYDALEALAEAVGDEKTAVLAREHRVQEEIFLKELRGLIPQLTQAVVAADIHGQPSYDPTKTGAADAVRAAEASVRDAARTARRQAETAASQADAAVRAAGHDVAEAARGTAQQAEERVEQTARGVAEEAKERAHEVSEAAKTQARRVPGEAELEGEVQGAQASAEELAIADYDSLNAVEVTPKLRGLPEVELAKIDAYERAHRNRKRVVTAIETIRTGSSAE